MPSGHVSVSKPKILTADFGSKQAKAFIETYDLQS
jgi:hypothetical protein